MARSTIHSFLSLSLNKLNQHLSFHFALLKEIIPMTWIKTIPFAEADEDLIRAIEAQRQLYPAEYAAPVRPSVNDEGADIVASHSLIPDALHHAFATFGALMSPDLPLTRRQHEMITTVVSVTNRCHY
jgi:hypothetical protein